MADYNNVFKDKCLIEFLKLQQCYTVRSHSNRDASSSNLMNHCRLRIRKNEVSIQGKDKGVIIDGAVIAYIADQINNLHPSKHLQHTHI